MHKSKNTDTSVKIEKSAIISFNYLLVINNSPDDNRYSISKSKEYVLGKLDSFETDFYRDFPLDDNNDKVWVGSNFYLADTYHSDYYLAKSANIKELTPVEKTMTLGELKKLNNKIFGKNSTPLLILKASTVPRSLLKK